MKRVKLSTLPKDTIVLVDGYSIVDTVEDILEDLENYKTKKIYTTIGHHAKFDARRILDDAIENQQENGMYEDWDESIQSDITQEDINDLQIIFDRILSRSSNIAYEADKLIEIDM